MTTRSALLRGAALGAMLAASLGAAAQAQTAVSNADLAAQIRQMQAQLAAMQAQLDAQEGAQAAAQAQVQAAQAQVAQTRTELVAAQTQAAAAQAKVAALPPPPSYSINFDGGSARITSGGSSVKIRGRLILDAVWQDIDRPGVLNDAKASQVRGRQAFIGVEGNIGPNWFYKMEGGAVNGGAWGWDDASIEYRHDARNAVIIGNQKVFSLEGMTATRSTSFLDRGPMDAVIDGNFQLGVAYWRTGANYSFNAGVFGHGLNFADVTPAAGSSGFHERLAVSSRATWAPVNTADTTVHLGVWGRYRKRGDDGPLAYVAGYNSSLKVQNPVTTGAVGDHDFTASLEGAWVHDNLSLQTELSNVRVDPGLAPSFDIRGGYVFGSVFLTGERRTYSVRGAFDRPKVLHPLSKDGLGALELLARYDFVDMTDAVTAAGLAIPTAGTYKAATLGATWYPINFVHFMANYTRGKYQNVGLANDAKVNLFQLRANIDW